MEAPLPFEGGKNESVRAQWEARSHFVSLCRKCLTSPTSVLTSFYTKMHETSILNCCIRTHTQFLAAWHHPEAVGSVGFCQLVGLEVVNRNGCSRVLES